MQRTRENTFRSYGKLKGLSDSGRADRYDNLKEKIKNEGFSSRSPIQIMLNRKDGKDEIFQGHHRLSIAIELGLSEVPVQFVTG